MGRISELESLVSHQSKSTSSTCWWYRIMTETGAICKLGNGLDTLRSLRRIEMYCGVPEMTLAELQMCDSLFRKVLSIVPRTTELSVLYTKLQILGQTHLPSIWSILLHNASQKKNNKQPPKQAQKPKSFLKVSSVAGLCWRAGVWYPQCTTAKPWTSEELPVSGSMCYCAVAENDLRALKQRWHLVWPWSWPPEWLSKFGSQEAPTTQSALFDGRWFLSSGSVQLSSSGPWSWLQPSVSTRIHHQALKTLQKSESGVENGDACAVVHLATKQVLSALQDLGFYLSALDTSPLVIIQL